MCLAPAAAASAAVFGGFTAGLVAGGLQGGVSGAFGASVFFGIGNYFEAAGPGMSAGAYYAQKTLAHGIAGGVLSRLEGGQFGHGFVSAGFTQLVSPGIEQIGSRAGRVFMAAIVGGTAAELGGGKFANGAVTGAFSRAFNDEGHDGFKKRLEITGKIYWDDVSGKLDAKHRQFILDSISDYYAIFEIDVTLTETNSVVGAVIFTVAEYERGHANVVLSLDETYVSAPGGIVVSYDDELDRSMVTILHEFGHLLGLNDKYNRQTGAVFPGYEKNLMGVPSRSISPILNDQQLQNIRAMGLSGRASNNLNYREVP